MSEMSIKNEDIEQRVDLIFKLYNDFGCKDYIGEDVSQSQHMVHCAMLAEQDGCEDEVVLSALLHDIGHLVGMQRGSSRMETGDTVLGAAQHEVIGANFLRSLGFPEVVSELVKGHVNAKRYLVYKDINYWKGLSQASKMTLVHQGGPMDAEEAANFEDSPYYTTILRMRRWDELAKDPTKTLVPLERYRDMCRNVIQRSFLDPSQENKDMVQESGRSPQSEL